ncbi:MAG: 2-oxoglutarate oxidoreductase [Chloroflexi bacterium]|nr:2-oxoglutarate oxidoreductase [Chloroflexota bacterium]
MVMMDVPTKVVYERPAVLDPRVTHYCPGCTHGVAHRLVGEVLEEMGEVGNTIGVASVGCSVFAYNYFNVDFVEAAHGRAPAMATGIKRLLPERTVFTYQGDGDLASIGMGEIVGAASRGELLTVIFINNTNYGMTGGQMAPTTLPGQVTTSSPTGRDVTRQGHPIQTSELLATLEGAAYVVRRSLHNVREVRRAKKAIRTAFEVQKKGLGFSLVELLSTCPTNWGLSAAEAREWVEERMLPYFPLGDYKISPAVAELDL